MAEFIFSTGQKECFNQAGDTIECKGSGQEVEVDCSRLAMSSQLARIDENLIQDQTTGLIWPSNAGLLDFPVNWQEALQWIDEQNQQGLYQRDDWRLPNRRELRTLIDHSTRRPALFKKELFHQVTTDWYWTSTTSSMANDYAWYLHFDGGRMFYGRKTEYHWVLPVCSSSRVITRTGQRKSYSDCAKDDGGLQYGVAWPERRFIAVNEGVRDVLTGLIWLETACLTKKLQSWQEAIAAVSHLRKTTGLNYRMPTINEMESLVDASNHSPALPKDHPFNEVQEAYWTTTTSGFEHDWSYVLYMHKGAVGVGFKTNRDFHVWPVLDDDCS